MTFIIVLLMISAVITFLLRPDIFFASFRGGNKEHAQRPKPRVLSPEEFEERLNGGRS